jgi:hypothetical protein
VSSWRCLVDRAEFRIRARSLDARREHLAADYEELLTDLRDAVATGNRHLDPDGMLDKRVDRASFWLFAIEPVFARGAAPHVASKDSEPAWWWRVDIEEGTHMDLRRWLDRCVREGLLVLELRDVPDGIRETYGDQLLSASDGAEAVERVLNPRAQAWLLAHWPAELREPGQPHDRARGRLT